MVEAVIVSHNSCHVLAKCVSSTLLQTRPFSNIYVLENGQCSGECLGELASECNFQTLDENRGFGAAVNEAVNASTNDFIVTLNPDVVLENDWVEKTIRIAEHDSRVGAVSSVALSSSTGHIDGFGDVMSWPGFHWRRLHGAPIYLKKFLPKSRRTDSVCAGYALYRLEAIRSVGGFFEPLFLYSEDVEIGLRLRSAKWDAVVTSETHARHLGGRSSKHTDIDINHFQKRNLAFMLYILGGRFRRKLIESFLGERLNLNELIASDAAQELIENHYKQRTPSAIRARFPWRFLRFWRQ